MTNPGELGESHNPYLYAVVDFIFLLHSAVMYTSGA